MKTEQPIECVGCNTFDVGTIIDGSNCSVAIEINYASEEDAMAALATFIQKARNAETDPCEIRWEMAEIDGGFQLKADFTFSCQAEALIFELSLR